MSIDVANMTDEEYRRWLNQAIENDGEIESDDIEVGSIDGNTEGNDDDDSIEVLDNDDDDSIDIEDDKEEEDDLADDESGDDLEQPGVDSNITVDDVNNEDVSNVDSDETKSNVDVQNTESNTEATTVDTVDVVAEKQPEQKFTYKANGQLFEFTEAEIKEQFGTVFSKAMNYTQKMQAIAEWRPVIDALETQNLTHNDINLIIDAYKGNKDAVAQIVKKSGIQPLELEINSENATEYTPNVYGRTVKEMEIADLENRIKADPAYGRTKNIINSLWDQESFNVLRGNIEFVEGLHEDVSNGTFDRLNPIAQKLKVFDNGKKTDIEYYALAAQQDKVARKAAVTQQDLQAKARELLAQEESAKIAKLAAIEQESKAKKAADTAAINKANIDAAKRKAATLTKSSAGNKIGEMFEDVASMSDEQFKKFMKKSLK